MKSAGKLAAIAVVVSACAGARAPERPTPAEIPTAGTLPPIPLAEGPLAIDVVYPREGHELQVRDSTFIFGNVGTGRATLRINGLPVTVEPNGSFLAFLPVPADGVYRAEASAGGNSVAAERRVRIPAPPTAAAPLPMIVQSSIGPRGALAVARGEPIEVSARATAGANVALVLTDGRRIALREDPGSTSAGLSTYRMIIPAQPLATRDPEVRRPRIGTTEQLTPERAPEPTSFGTIELIAGRDTVRTLLPLNLTVLDPSRPVFGIAADPNPVGGTNDGYVVGRPAPGTVSHYFWPNGTEFQIIGERANEFQVRLSETLTAFVSAEEVRLQPGSRSPSRTMVSNVNLQPAADWIDVRFPISRRLPFAVAQTERSLSVTLYGATSATDWLTYGKKDPLIQHAEWEQPEDGVYRLRVDLTQPVWGYQTFWSETGNTLVLRIRRPPVIDASNPLRGLLVTVDPGHGPPEGRWGPTRLTEAQANLAVALRLRDLIAAAGGRVQLTRTDSSAVGLYDRPSMATREHAHLFLSIHHDAVADGVDPRTTPYTSSFFFHAHSTDFARALQNALVDEIGLRERGYVRASLAVVRWPTWFPAVLTEAMFFIMPQQEAALRNPAMIDRLARAHLRGIEAFLRSRAAAQ